MTDIAVFNYADLEVRTVLIDDQPWFVVADLCRVLDLSNPTVVASRLDDDDLSTTEVIDSMGRTQTARITNEAGMYQLVFMSRKPSAKEFRRWVTTEVLPAIRKTGRYETSPAPALPQTYAAALRELLASVEREEAVKAQLEQVTPSAEAWDHLASATGDYAVADAAKILSRNPLVKVGRDRLFTHLARFGWTYRRELDGRWTVYQRAVDTGWVTELASSHYHPRTGELVLDAPQVRITAKGLAELQKRLTGTQTQIEAA
jgi:prophage antirepressor-like protein